MKAALVQPPSRSLQGQLLRIQLAVVLLFLLGAALFGWRMTVLDQTIERHFDIAGRIRLLHSLELVAPPALISHGGLASGMQGRDLTNFARSDISSMIRTLEDRAFATETDYRSQMTWVGLTWSVMLLMPLALAFWPLRFSRSVIEGIQHLSRRVEAGFAGVVASGTCRERKDEIGALGHAIDEMFADLRHREMEAGLSRQLRQEQQKLADVVSLVGGIAHEVANPLSVILANLDCLESSGAFPEIDNIREGLRRIQDLLGDVTAFSAGDDDAGLVNINEVAASAFRVVGLDDRLRSNRLLVDFDPLLPAVPFSRTVMTLATFSLMSLGAAMLGGGRGGIRVSSSLASGIAELRIRVSGAAETEALSAMAPVSEAHPTILALGRVIRGYGAELVLPRSGDFRLRFPLISHAQREPLHV